MPMAGVAAFAQQEVTITENNYGPQKGDFSVAVTLGSNSFTTIQAMDGAQTSYQGAALTNNWTQKGLGFGLELGKYLGRNWKLTLGGAFNFTTNPGYPGVDGTYGSYEWVDGMGTFPSDEVGDGSIPSYRAVASQRSYNYQVYFAATKHYAVKHVKNMNWYYGGQVGYAYGFNQMRYDEEQSMGTSNAETMNLRLAPVVGVEYFIAHGMYIGAQIAPLAYTYNYTTYRPQEGLANLSANSHSIGLMVNPMLKVGFKFGKSNKNAYKTITIQPKTIYKTDTVTVTKEVIVEKEAPRVAYKAEIYYKVGKSVPEVEELAKLYALKNYMETYPNTKVSVDSYADKGTGSSASNKKLSEKRSAYVKDMLIKYGVPASRITVSDHGDSVQPFSNNDQNRVTVCVTD